MGHGPLIRLALAHLIAILLIGESVYFFWFSYVIDRLFAEAFGVVAVPLGVWINLAKGAVLVLFAAHIIQKGKVGHWFIAVAALLLIHGSWGAWSAYGAVNSISGFLEGDVTALEFISSMGFVGIGLLTWCSFAFTNRQF